MRLVLIVAVAVILILVLVFVFILPAGDVAENDGPQPNNDEAIGEEPEDPIDEAILPEGLPVYPGAIFISHTESENEDIFEFQTSDSPEDVALFYVAEFESEGYEDFMYYYDSEMSEVQLERDGKLVTVMADAVNESTDIKISIRSLQ